MMEDTGEDILRQKPSMVGSFFKWMGQTYQKFLDESTPHVVSGVPSLNNNNYINVSTRDFDARN